MRWTDVLEIQAQMQGLLGLPEAKAPLSNALKNGVCVQTAPPSLRDNWQFFARVLAEMFRRGQPFWVQRDMLALAEAAAHTMPPQPILVSDLPCSDGCIFFEEAIILHNRIGGTIRFRALIWHAQPAGVHVVPMFEDDQDKGPLPRGHRLLHWPLYPFDSAFWTWNAAPRTNPDEDRTEKNSGWMLYRLPLSLWILMGQRITVTDTVDPERASRRRMSKGPKLDVDKIKIIRLRKMDYARSDNEVHVAWSHRWLVSGHWKNQWFPSLKTHRLIWVAAHIKGPESKPLVLKDTVGLLMR